MVELSQREDGMWTWCYTEDTSTFWSSKSYPSADEAIQAVLRAYPETEMLENTFIEGSAAGSPPQDGPDDVPKPDSGLVSTMLMALAVIRLRRAWKRRSEQSE